MTQLAPAPAPAVPLAAPLGPPPGFGSRFALSWRLLRRNAALMAVAGAAYMAMEILVFRRTYPDEASRHRLLELATSTVVRMMQGRPGAIDSAGGFAVWDAGWMLTLLVACWALLTATRWTRGEEDAGRAELVLSRPLTARQALAAHLAAMATAAAGVGVATTLPFLVLGEPVAGAVVWGLGVAATGALAAALGVLAAQLFQPRRRAATAGLALLAAAFMVRIVADSADRRSWLLTVSPFGWIERLRAFSSNDWAWLAAPAAAALILAGAALAAGDRRDLGAALIRSSAAHRSSFRLLGSAPGLGWRLSSGTLLAWTATLAGTSVVFGLMTEALIEFINTDEAYRRVLESMGVDLSAPAVGYLSYLAVFFALAFAAFLSWRIGASRQEEASGRLDNLLARGVPRWRWLAVTTGHAVLAAVILLAATTAALWAGTRLVNAPVSAWQVTEPMAGTLPLIVLFAGLAVLTFGLAPRLTVGVPATLAILGYLLETFGSMLGWPDAVLALSPFHHLARLPGQPMTVTAMLAMTAAGLALAAAGVVAFARRDLPDQ